MVTTPLDRWFTNSTQKPLNTGTLPRTESALMDPPVGSVTVVPEVAKQVTMPVRSWAAVIVAAVGTEEAARVFTSTPPMFMMKAEAPVYTGIV